MRRLFLTLADPAAALLADLRAWRTRTGAQLPAPNPAFDPARAAEGPAKGKRPKKDKPAQKGAPEAGDMRAADAAPHLLRRAETSAGRPP